MTFLELLALTTSLSLDVAVVSVGAGSFNRLRVRSAVLIALVFTIFHAGFLALGALAGTMFIEQAVYGRFIGFALLFIVGMKMLYEAWRGENTARERDILKPLTLIVLALAVSIDTLAVGITLSLLGESVLRATVTLAIVTFLFSMVGLYAGHRGKRLIGTKVEFVGAAVLIILAFKILFGA